MTRDWNWILGGLAAAILLPVLIVFKTPFVIALFIAGAAFAGITVLLGPRRLFEGVNISQVSQDKVALARSLLEKAAPAIDQIEQTARQIKSGVVRTRVQNLAGMARTIFAKVEAKPENVGSVDRFLEFYLPRAASIAEGYQKVEARPEGDPERLDQIRGVIEKLELGFDHYSESLAEVELGSLDADIRQIETSLSEDLKH
ncbi:MAG: 5-bromo-4-chloroindolyl phosphate hydrolysis family protein [Hyphomicrobiaceae bacterium]|nr:5-bromo-4-chloroindolyl phosphate hydrolysis family protein [Hyphomicrobiaceae bacterium]